MSREPGIAHWFGKPEGMSHDDLFSRLAPLVDRAQGALWMRQMVLGPTPEFCLHSWAAVELPPGIAGHTLSLTPVWPPAA